MIKENSFFFSLLLNKSNNKQKYILEIGKNNFFPSPGEEQNRKKITEARIQVEKNKNLKKDMLNRYSKPVNKNILKINYF